MISLAQYQHVFDKLIDLADPIKPGLPGYVWDTRMRGGRFRELTPDGKLGKLVSQQFIADNIRGLHASSQASLAQLGEAVATGELSPGAFEIAMQTELKALHNANAAVAWGGWDQVPQSTWGRNGARLSAEYSYLNDFVVAVIEEEMTPEEAARRAGLYADNAYGRFWDEQDRQISENHTFPEKAFRTEQDDRVCVLCKNEERVGWIPVTDFTFRAPPIHPNCRCTILYR